MRSLDNRGLPAPEVGKAEKGTDKGGKHYFEWYSGISEVELRRTISQIIFIATLRRVNPKSKLLSQQWVS